MANWLHTDACAMSVYTDCLGSALPEIAVGAPITAAGALTINSNNNLAPTGAAQAVFTLPVTTLIGGGVMVRWNDGTTPIQVTGGTPATTVVLDVPAPTAPGFAYMRWNGSKWTVVQRSQSAYMCPGDQNA